MPRTRLIIDLSLCYGCEACVDACRTEHLVPFDTSWISVKKSRVKEQEAAVISFHMCVHCDNPACLKACTHSAMYQDEDSIVRIDREKCTGCGACVKACTYNALSISSPSSVIVDSRHLTEKQKATRELRIIEAEKQIPAKCELCPERRKNNRPTACEAACPVEAIKQKQY